MSRKQKRVVRRKSQATKGKKSEIKKRSRAASNTRKGSVGRNSGNARKGKKAKTRNQSRRAATKRKSASRKSHASRKRQQRKDKHPRLTKKKKTRGRARQTDEEIFDEGEDFIGPVGDSYDDDFADIDWKSVDWDDVIDDIGDEEVDVYGDEAK